MNNSKKNLNNCGCCEGLSTQTPAEISNRPGLNAIVYRTGTHHSFKQTMLAALSDSNKPILQNLTTRDDDDFSIALLDAWATVADVLTFYQERLANESYLRTAQERLSLLQLARTIGYELRPGVAAGTYLAFTLEEAPGAPEQAIQQTIIDTGTRVQSIPGPDENAQMFESVEKIEGRVAWNALKPKTTKMVLPGSGTSTIYLKGTTLNLKVGDALLFIGNGWNSDEESDTWNFRRIKIMEIDNKAGYTKITLNQELNILNSSGESVDCSKVYVFRLRAALFGYNAPDPRLLHSNTIIQFFPSDNIVEMKPATSVVSVIDNNDTEIIKEWTFEFENQSIFLDSIYPGITQGSWIVLSKPDFQQPYSVSSVTEDSQTNYALTAKTTRIILNTDENLSEYEGDAYRSTVVFAQSEELELAEEPIVDPVSGDSVDLNQEVEGLFAGQLLAITGTEETTGELISEVVTVKNSELIDEYTRITFSRPLQHSFCRDSVTINANVARATHGETVAEVLGSGNASQAWQRFVLRQSPLTHVSAATPGGTESTLEVRVNDLLWQEVPALLGQKPGNRVYCTRRDDAGATTIQFGDGAEGGRLSSGQENVRAVYRKGLGLGGNVKANQLSLLLTRPLGVKSVTNPLAATGGADPESRDDARKNAPLTVLTLDRAVSLRDYEDLSQSFAGIAKALASWTWINQQQFIFITVAGPNGAVIPSDSDTCRNLRKALQQAGDPFTHLCIMTYRPVSFRIAGTVLVEPEYLPEKVRTTIEQSLRQTFSFNLRAFGQPVTLSEVIATIQAVPGVRAVDIDKLYRDQSVSLQERLLADLPEGGGQGEIAAAELLTLDPAPLDALEVTL